MKDWLLKVEAEYEIEILYACEGGSRAWGIETNQSDYDIRFIYRYKDIKNYLSLRKYPETIDLVEPFDITGFDLYKSFQLILKSNPSLYEIAFSPIIYVDNKDFASRLQRTIENGYSLFSLFQHYHSLKKRNLKEMSKGEYDLKKQKKLIQALRADLICDGLVESKRVQSPFVYMEDAKKRNHEKFHRYELIIAAKKSNRLLSTDAVNKIVYLLELSNIETKMETKVKPDLVRMELENWLWELFDLK